jgi:hypothetical protein
MPLTFSHPAIVLPLNYLPKRWVSLTGLIVGSVAPDFEYFFRMKVSSIYSHTWLGLFWFDLPASIVLAFVYHNIVRSQFIVNLPAAINRRFSEYNHFNWNQYFIQNLPVVILSILIGGASHLFWDSFTHITGYFVEVWNMTVPVKIFSLQLPLYKLIQHLSTLVGGLVIIIAIYKMPLQMQSNNKQIWPYWSVVVGIILTVLILRVLFGLDIHQYWNVLVTAISGGILGVVLAPVFIKGISVK